jgi:hypothetical protein
VRWLLVLVPLCALADQSVPRTFVRFDVTPGKPMELARAGEPAERITVERDGARVVMTVARNVGKKWESGRASLSDGEWRSIETQARALVAWKARPTGEHADDFATTAFALQLADGKNEQRWSQPIADGSAPAALATTLGRLARAKIATPYLHYFGD